jgi:DNA replication protein DnaC
MTSSPWRPSDDGPTQLLEHVAELEQAERAQRSLERRVDRSHLGRFRSMADFDWAWPSHIDRELVDAVLQLSFLPEACNVVLVAPQGLGKTMIAQNIVHAALLAGHSALFVTASQLLLDLGAQESTRALGCGIHSIAITETGPSRSPKPIDGDHRKRSIAIGGPANQGDPPELIRGCGQA